MTHTKLVNALLQIEAIAANLRFNLGNNPNLIDPSGRTAQRIEEAKEHMAFIDAAVAAMALQQDKTPL